MGYDFDLFVIGGGSGGVRCARIAAGHGARVGVAEERFWGGTCVNIGCVPKKLMVMAAEYGNAAQDAQGFGWSHSEATFDWPTLITAKNREIARLNGAYTGLLERAGVKVFDARAVFIDAHTLDVGGTRMTAERIVIATGGRPVPLPIPGGEHAIVSDAAFYLPELPKRVLMFGGGYIAVEFAGIFRGLGAEVDLVMRHTLSGRVRKTLMKLIVDHASQKVIGAHMIGEDAAEIMQGLSIAINAGATKRDFDRTVGIHPTAAEEFVTMRTVTRVVG